MDEHIKDLTITSVEPFETHICNGVEIKWDANIGWGTYTIYKYKDSDIWHGDSECMDKGEDKDFLRELLNKFVDQIKIDD